LSARAVRTCWAADRRTARSVAGLLLAALAAAPVARAEDPRRPARAATPPLADAPSAPAEPATPPGYDLAVELGFASFEQGDYRAAREQFAAAHALYPNARTLRALGKVEYELSQYLPSIVFLEAALASSERPLTASQRVETEELLARVRSHVAPVILGVSPLGARLLLDGVAVDLPPGGRFLLPVGDHLLEASAPGRLAERHVLHVEPGHELRLNVLLSASPNAAEPERRPLYKNPWLWGGVVVVVSAAVVAGVAVALHDPETRQPSGGSSGLTITLPEP
jgi:hypothetical protein